MKLLFWRRPRISVLVLHGVLAARVGTLNLAGYSGLIDRACSRAARSGHLVLDINSPGGSPVQSDLIAARIRRRAEANGAKVVAVIAVSTWGVLREAARLAMDGVPQAIATPEVEAYLRSLPGVVEVHDLHIWGLSTTETALTAHLVHADPHPGEDLVLTACRDLSARFRIGHATLQVESAALAAACRLRPADVV